jgi:DNA-binding XRE family transcriptional regulator
MSKTEKLPLLKDFGAKVRDYRMERGLSQETFADACEIDRSCMGGVERGERNLALVNIVASSRR